MEYFKKILSFVILSSIFITVPFTQLTTFSGTEETIEIHSNSINIYFPFISSTDPIVINLAYGCCSRNHQLTCIQGWIENLSVNTIYSVTLTLTIFNEITRVYDSFDFTPELDATFSNNVNPFKWRMSSPITSEPYRCSPGDFQVNVKSWSFYSSSEYRPVTVLSANIEKRPTEWEWYVSGEIRNDQEVELRDVKVVLVPHCSLLRVASVEDMVLSPGEKTHYSGTIAYYWDPWDPDPSRCESVEVVCQGNMIP